MKKLIRLLLTIFTIASSLFFLSNKAFAFSSEYDELMLNKINAYREANGLSKLEYNEDLNKVAELRINELPINFDHFRPDGNSYKTAYTELGLMDKFERGSENIARIFGNWDFKENSSEEYVDCIFEAYINSDSHKENILKPYWKYYSGAFLTNYNGNCYQIQVFGK